MAQVVSLTRRIQMKLLACAVSGQCSLILAFLTARIKLDNLGSNTRMLRQRPLCCRLRHCLCRTCCGLTGCWPCDGIKRGMRSRRSCMVDSFVHSSRSHLCGSRVDALEHGRVLQHVRDDQVPAVSRGEGISMVIKALSTILACVYPRILWPHLTWLPRMKAFSS